MKKLLLILSGIIFSQISAIRFNDNSYGTGSETALIQTLDGYHTTSASHDVILDTADDYDGFWGEPIVDTYGSSPLLGSDVDVRNTPVINNDFANESYYPSNFANESSDTGDTGSSFNYTDNDGAL